MYDILPLHVFSAFHLSLTCAHRTRFVCLFHAPNVFTCLNLSKQHCLEFEIALPSTMSAQKQLRRRKTAALPTLLVSDVEQALEDHFSYVGTRDMSQILKGLRNATAKTAPVASGFLFFLFLFLE